VVLRCNGTFEVRGKGPKSLLAAVIHRVVDRKRGPLVGNEKRNYLRRMVRISEENKIKKVPESAVGQLNTPPGGLH